MYIVGFCLQRSLVAKKTIVRMVVFVKRKKENLSVTVHPCGAVKHANNNVKHLLYLCQLFFSLRKSSLAKCVK